MALELNHQTAGEFADRFWTRVRQAYQSGDRETFHRLIWWAWQRVQDGDLTNDQVRLSYNKAYGKSLNPAQWSSFVANRLIPVKDRYLAYLAEEDL